MKNLITCTININEEKTELLDEHDNVLMQIIPMIEGMDNCSITFTIYFDNANHLVVKNINWIIMQEVIISLLNGFKKYTNHLSIALDIYSTTR